MPAVYDSLGVRFLYPDNWTLDDQEAVAGNRSVAVYSPGGAFWSIALHGADADPAALAAEAVQVMKKEYDSTEAEPASEHVADETLRGYDLNFFYLDLTSTAQIRAFRLRDLTCVVFCQAEDREFVTAGPVFKAILTSLLVENPAVWNEQE